MLSTWPLYFFPYASTEMVARWPGRMRRSWFSLKLAVTQMSSRLMIFINSWPIGTFWPTSTVRLLTMPLTGATSRVYCRFSRA